MRLSQTVLVILLALTAACDDGGWSWDEVARTRSPDGARDAVVVERNGGPTTSFGYEVFVVPHGATVLEGRPGAVASLYAATRNAQASGVNLRWLTGDTLAVEYLAAREAVVHPTALSHRPDPVRVVLRPGVEDPQAPGGGMLDNAKHPDTRPPNGR